MAFPLIHTKSTNFTITPQLRTLLEQKFTPLEKYIDSKSDVTCDIELEKIGDHHSGRIFRAEVNLYTHGTMFRAEATEELMEHAIDVIRDELKRELHHVHDKQRSLVRRGSQAIKNMLRFGK
jgi:ribosomal subunit interface protein